MKKLSVFLSVVLVFSLALCPMAAAAGDNYDTLADWDLQVAVPEEASAAVLQGNLYYLYAQQEGYIPYVMLTATSRFDSEEAFIDYMNDSMAFQYRNQDFSISAPAELTEIGGRLCYEIEYSYTVSGYPAVDRRIFIMVGKLVYMFASKEIPSLDLTVGTMLEDVFSNCVFLSEKSGDDVESPNEDNSELYNAYLFCLDNGMPKYWLDLTGAITDNPVLHCYFRSGDPTFYESVFILDLDSAEIEGNHVSFFKVCDEKGYDVSPWFDRVSVDFYTDGAVLEVERDEATLAGGPEDNLLTGTYPMDPAAAEVRYEYRDDNGKPKYWLVPNGDDMELHGNFLSGDPETYEEVYVLDGDSAERSNDYVISYSKVFKNGSDVSRWFKSIVLSQVQNSYILSVKRDESTLAGGAGDNILTGSYLFDPYVDFFPPETGPYTEDDLALLAQQYYFKGTGFFPPETEITQNEDGSFSVHLYEVVETDGVPHTATSAWYTVDSFGVGINDITGEEVYLAS